MADRAIPHRARLLAPAILLLLASCGDVQPIDASALPSPSAREAWSLSYEVCSTSVERYGVRRVARYLDAASTGPQAIARAYVREALELTDGWAPYRSAGARGCAAGVRHATA